MSRINIFNATAEDFQIEVFSSAPVDGSSGDYEDGRIVKYATHFYMWHDASGEWKKFGNSTDITSLETRLSVQESSQAIAEASMVAIDSSLQSRISTEEIARSSSIDSEETRAVLAEEAISGNLSSELVDRAADVSAEASRASSAEVVLSTNLSSGIVAREADVSVEKARAEAAEGSLQTRLAAEESNELSAETSLNLRASTEESTRLAADNSVAVTISAEASTARSAETSLESRLSSEEDRVDAILAASTADKNTFVETVSFINAIDVAHDAQTSTQISSVDSAIASAESSRIASDSSLQTRLSSEESTEASAEASLNTRMTAEASNELSAEGSLDARSSAEESLRLAEDTSLETRLAAEESNELSAETSLDTRVSSEASAQVLADGSLQTRFSGELSVERSKLDDILDSAAADKDTFVEIVSFITSVDTDSDDALASYVVAVDADISTEVSTARSAEAVLSTNLSSEVSAMGSAVAATYATISGNIATHAAAIDTKEQHEGVGRHVRIDFTNQTTFSVAAVDLPTNFEPGNGMAQIFQEVSSGVYRHLVAPSTYNASTGVMSFDLGVSQKSGFAVFYSFAGDEGTATEVATNVSHAITGVDISGLTLASNTSSEIKVNFSGVSASDYEKHMSFTEEVLFQFTDASSTLTPNTPGNYSGSLYPQMTATWESDYSAVTYSWTNPSTSITLGEELSNGYSRVKMYIGNYTSSTNSAYWAIYMELHIDKDDITSLKTDSGFGKALSDNSSSLPTYTYYEASNGIEEYDYVSNTSPRWKWAVPTDQVSVDGYRNDKVGYVGSGFWNPLGAIFVRGGMTFTSGGNDYYWFNTSHSSMQLIGYSHHLYSEITSGRTARTATYTAYSDTGAASTSYKGIQMTSLGLQPDANTDVVFYGLMHSDNGSNTIGYKQGLPDNAATDVKMVISMNDRTESNMTVKYYRNSGTDAGNVNWVEVDRFYLHGHDVS